MRHGARSRRSTHLRDARGGCSAVLTAKPKKTKAPGPATGFSGEGEYLVGEDGTGPEDEFGCYWERAKDASGEFANRCQEWKRVG